MRLNVASHGGKFQEIFVAAIKLSSTF